MGQDRPLKIAYLCDQPPDDRFTYSGGNQRICNALRDHVGEVTVLGSGWHAAQPVRALIEAMPDRITMRADWRAHLALARIIARGVRRELAKDRYDVLFCAYSFQSLMGLNLPYPMLRVFSSDATPTAYKRSEVGQEFGSYLRIARVLDPLILRAERRVFRSCDLLFWPSAWLKSEADALYDLAPTASHLVPWGANIDDPGTAAPVPINAGAPLHLLLLGRDWYAKGGPIAHDTMQALRDRGLDARLTVIGCTPPDHHRNAHVTVHAHLDKSRADERRTLLHHLQTAHFMVMPSYESYGFAFCEASAHGLPSLCLRVGGVPVRDGINGHALHPGATAAEFTACIARYVDDADGYAKLRQSSRQEYMTRLNWASWGETVRARLLAARASASGAAQHHTEGPHHDPQIGQE